MESGAVGGGGGAGAGAGWMEKGGGGEAVKGICDISVTMGLSKVVWKFIVRKMTASSCRESKEN